MPYDVFTLRSLMQQFPITLHDTTDLYAEVREVVPDAAFLARLEDEAALALAVSTEKARSEFIIAPIVAELRRVTGRRIGLFFGIVFNIDESADEYPLQSIENRDVPFSWRVTRMRLSKDRTQLVVNESLTLGNIPPACFAYRLGNRSALEWIVDQYQVTTDKRSGLVSDPNRQDDPEYIARLVGRVVTVSLRTVQLVAALGDGAA